MPCALTAAPPPCRCPGIRPASDGLRRAYGAPWAPPAAPPRRRVSRHPPGSDGHRRATDGPQRLRRPAGYPGIQPASDGPGGPTACPGRRQRLRRVSRNPPGSDGHRRATDGPQRLRRPAGYPGIRPALVPPLVSPPPGLGSQDRGGRLFRRRENRRRGCGAAHNPGGNRAHTTRPQRPRP